MNRIAAMVFVCLVLGFVSKGFSQLSEPTLLIFQQENTNPIDLKEYLLQFHRDPSKVMNAPLAKRTADGRIVSAPSAFEQADISIDEMMQARSATRNHVCSAAGVSCDTSSGLFAASSPTNQIASFLFESTYIQKLSEMEQAALTEAILPNPPWSDSFWAMKTGLIARRWADPQLPATKQWLDHYAYYIQFPPALMPVENLSPSEKYDLLVGDATNALTNSMWAAGKKYIDQGLLVPSWAGLCHGWSPASIMTPNPKKSVTVYSATGFPVLFYPSDIKALAALAWGEAAPRYKVVGRRCKTADPAQDSVGRVLDDDCFDVNPGTWHMAVVNQIGVTKRSFVFDATFDKQVWNYPISAYQYSYFNPQTLSVSANMAPSVVRISDFAIDKFKAYRSPQTKYVVGIAMDLTYSLPTQASRRPTKSPLPHTVRYVYDVELDQDGLIVGGEWYSNFHPDFIWNLPPDGRPISKGELEMNPRITWDGRTPLPSNLTAAALVSASVSQPLVTIVEALVQLGQEE